MLILEYLGTMQEIEIKLSSVYDLEEYLQNSRIAAFCTTNAGKLILALAPGEKPEKVSLSRSILQEPQRYRILVESNECLEVLCITEEEYLDISMVQLIPDDRLLLLSGRTSLYLDKAPEKNARIYDRTGKLLKELFLGDGILHCQVSPGGLIWTGYFDEGVYASGPTGGDVGSSGLVAWDLLGNKVYDYKPVQELDVIDDCYGLNVISDSLVYCNYYSQFPFVRIENFKVTRYWKEAVATECFAVKDNFVLFRAPYLEREKLFLIALKENGAHSRIAKIGVFDGNKNLLKNSLVSARKDVILILNENRYVYRLSVDELLKNIPQSK